MTEIDFSELRKAGYTHCIVRHKILADTLTPVSIYQRLADGPKSYLLESIEGSERWSRFSVVGLPASEWISAKDGHIEHYVNKALAESVDANPLDYLQRVFAGFNVANLPKDLPFSGGLVGYFGYDAIGYIEKRLAKRPEKDPLQMPDVLFMVSTAIVVMDNLRGEANIMVLADLADAEAQAKAEKQIQDIVHKLTEPFRHPPLSLGKPHPEDFHPTYEMGEARFKEVVRKIKDYVIAGDVMQVVPSQRMSIPYTRDAMDFYRALRITNPSPYMYLLNMGDFDIVGSSPEILARLENGRVTVRPIAGTRKRGKTEAEDLALEKELLSDEKELAEHTMLIDLGRNDVGRVSQPGSVVLTEKMIIERYSHVMHIVSNVEGNLKPGLDAVDVFKATFPAGTLSGASKIRAMEVIDELEVSRRGVYGGAVGYWSWQGNMDMCIAIRTGVIKNEKLYVQAGAGIVYDSNPEQEWQETLNKLGALIKAVSMLE